MAKLPGVADALPVPQSQAGIVRVPNDPYSAQLAQSGAQLSQIGQELKSAFDQEKRRIDTAQVEDAFNELRNKQINLTLGEEDGFANMKGGDAVKKPLLKDWSQKFDDATEEIVSRLNNDEQRRAFKARSDVARSQYTQDILQHLARENGAYQKQVMGATIDTERRAAGLRWSNPADVMGSLERTKAAVKTYADANGIDGVVLENMQVEAASSIHANVIGEALVNNNPAYAKLYFSTHRKEIDESTALQLQKAITEGDLRFNAQQKTDEIMARHDNNEALAKAREISDPELRDNVVGRVKTRIQENQAIKNQVENDNADSAWKIIVDGGGRDSIPPTVWANLRGTDQKQIVDYIKARDQKAPRKSDDLSVYEKVSKMIEQGDITDTEQLLYYEPYLKEATIKTLRKEIEKSGKVNPTAVKNAFQDRLGKTRAKWGSKEYEQWLAFQDYILTNVQETKRPEDVDSWADRWFMEGYGTESSLFANDPDTFGEARMQGRTDFLIEAPDDARLEVERSLSVLRNAGASVPQGGKGVDEFYTKYQLEAQRWFSARDMPATPERVAAYSILVGKNKPVTPANIEYISVQLK